MFCTCLDTNTGRDRVGKKKSNTKGLLIRTFFFIVRSEFANMVIVRCALGDLIGIYIMYIQKSKKKKKDTISQLNKTNYVIENTKAAR